MSNLDVSLDDLIKKNKKSAVPKPRVGRDRSSGPGPSRRLPDRSSNRPSPYSIAPVQAPETTWQHDMFVDNVSAIPVPAGRVAGIETGIKLFISNLDYGVSNEDIKELFSDVGDIKRFSVHYDRSGRSEGTADVVFSRRKDAETALKRYNNVELDGKPMKIKIVESRNAATVAMTVSTNSSYGNQSGAPGRSQGRGGVMDRLRGSGRPSTTVPLRGGSRGGSSGGGRGRGRGFGRGPKIMEKVSAEDLDADLERYHAESMQTN
ncbi:hypothetical protein LguiA_032203 [Lonicera macranthoides]